MRPACLLRRFRCGFGPHSSNAHPLKERTLSLGVASKGEPKTLFSRVRVNRLRADRQNRRSGDAAVLADIKWQASPR
jgi:hypothetical protein